VTISDALPLEGPQFLSATTNETSISK